VHFVNLPLYYENDPQEKPEENPAELGIFKTEIPLKMAIHQSADPYIQTSALCGVIVNILEDCYNIVIKNSLC
jgi:hypothetical protein